MKSFFTTEQEWFNKWDAFLLLQDRGTHLQNSNWLNSYKSYGFTIELFLMLEESKEIIGGFIAVIAKKSIFKFYVIPQGPIVKQSKERYLKDAFNQIYLRSKLLKCSYAQFSIPISSHCLIRDFTYPNSVRSIIPKTFKQGKKFKYIYAGYGINWVDLTKFDDFNAYLSHLKPQVRRNIKLAFNRNDQVEYLSTGSSKEELEAIYKLVTNNAKQFNYSVRHFSDIGDDLLILLRKGLGVYQNISNNSQIVSTGFSIAHSKYLVYLFGGTKRMRPDTKSGYLVHSMNIKRSLEQGMSGYNISMGGSEGVREFKRKFESEEIYFEEPHYYCIHNAFLFNIFQSLENILKRHKGLIAKYLK